MKNKCHCYHTQKKTLYTYNQYTGSPIPHDVEVGVCWGTRETDECNCGGDETQCDFYSEVRERAKKELKKVVTNGDNIRSMTNENLAEFLDEFVHTGACNDFGIAHERECDSNCVECIKEWLQQSVKE